MTVTCLMPSATETEFFERAGMMDTKVGPKDKMIDACWRMPRVDDRALHLVSRSQDGSRMGEK